MVLGGISRLIKVVPWQTNKIFSIEFPHIFCVIAKALVPVAISGGIIAYSPVGVKSGLWALQREEIGEMLAFRAFREYNSVEIFFFPLDISEKVVYIGEQHL